MMKGYGSSPTSHVERTNNRNRHVVAQLDFEELQVLAVVTT
jgi:hypothetical protein